MKKYSLNERSQDVLNRKPRLTFLLGWYSKRMYEGTIDWIQEKRFSMLLRWAFIKCKITGRNFHGL